MESVNTWQEEIAFCILCSTLSYDWRWWVVTSYVKNMQHGLDIIGLHFTDLDILHFRILVSEFYRSLPLEKWFFDDRNSQINDILWSDQLKQILVWSHESLHSCYFSSTIFSVAASSSDIVYLNGHCTFLFTPTDSTLHTWYIPQTCLQDKHQWSQISNNMILLVIFNWNKEDGFSQIESIFSFQWHQHPGCDNLIDPILIQLSETCLHGLLY